MRKRTLEELFMDAAIKNAAIAQLILGILVVALIVGVFA